MHPASGTPVIMCGSDTPSTTPAGPRTQTDPSTLSARAEGSAF